MQRLFSMFPLGRAGVALLLLRVALSLAILCSASMTSPWMLAMFGVLALALCLGLLTPVVTVSCVVLEIIAWRSTGQNVAVMQVCTIVDAVALALLGPGGYSFDARLFGRQRVIVPNPDRLDVE